MTTADGASHPIRIEQVDKVYPGGVRALDGASFAIAPGERACLLGPNGAGKTTLVRLITGALRPTRGSARLFGRASTDDGFLDARRRVGVVPQNPGMYRDVTVLEYLTLVARLYRRGTAREALERFGLGEHAGRAMSQLSGGYQRRLALAAALMPSPDLLVLDEPTVGLDPVAQREVQAYLREAMKSRTTLLCTHNLAEAEALCSTAVIVREGRVLLHASIDELRARVPPRLALTAREGAEALRRALGALGLRVDDVRGDEATDDEVLVDVADAPREAPGILRGLLDAGVGVYECRVVTPTLEDLFLRTVEGGRDG